VPKPRSRKTSVIAAALVLCAGASGCASYASRHPITGDNASQILLSDSSQVRVRSAQSRVFDTTDRIAMMAAVVATLQDLGFQVELLDEVLGIISAKQFLPLATTPAQRGVAYMLYDEETLVVLQKSYRSWAPFFRRSDLVRLTVTVRTRNQKQLIVRAAAQRWLQPVEEPAAYQRFYAALEQSLFIKRLGGGSSASAGGGG